MSAAEATIVHAYGLVDPKASQTPSTGIGGRPVFVHPASLEVAVLVSELDEQRYGADQWREHAEDPEWLAAVAGEHHQVLQEQLGSGDVLPLRLPSIHPDLGSLDEALGREGEALRSAFEDVRGRVEMGAKAYVVGGGREAEGAPPATNGRDYLRRRSDQAQAKDRARTRRQAQLLDAHEELTRESVRAVSNPPQDSALSGRAERMVLNTAYLVDRDRSDAFVARCEELGDSLREEGIELEATGPWPPYNFVAPPQREPGPAAEPPVPT